MRIPAVLRVALSLALALALLAQQAPQTSTDGIAKFTSSTQLVVQMVTVKDKSGKVVEGLTAKDFTVTEDGKPQAIAFCEFQRLEEAAPPPPPVVAPTGVAPPTRFQIT